MPQRPLSDAEMSEKFQSCAAGVLSAEAAAAAEAGVADLDRLDDIRGLLRSLRPGAKLIKSLAPSHGFP